MTETVYFGVIQTTLRQHQLRQCCDYGQVEAARYSVTLGLQVGPIKLHDTGFVGVSQVKLRDTGFVDGSSQTQ